MKKILKSIFTTILVIVLSMNLSFAGTYTVKANDVLWIIAKKIGTCINELKEANNIEDEKMIYPGQVLITEKGGPPKYVFMFIGDGLGSSQRQISEYFLQQQSNDSSRRLRMNTFQISGINTTHSADSLITDSAAAGTALATGVKTNNGYISKDVEGNNVETLIELAEKAGKSTGLVSTTRLTHATPATFAAHNINRNNENAIAEDFLDSGVDFFAGGGLSHFIPKNYKTNTKDYSGAIIKSERLDDRNLVDEFSLKGYKTYVGKEGTDAFKNASYDELGQIFATFTNTHMPYELDRLNEYPEIPSLAEMTDKAIDLLEEDKDGFFLMVEGGRIDHAAHSNDVASMINDVIAFDDAINEAYEFYKEHPEETLILVVGDHETGGLKFGMFRRGYFVDLATLLTAKGSIGNVVSLYNGDREGFINYVEKNLGLVDLTVDELLEINKSTEGLNLYKDFDYNAYNPAGMALSNLISKRANVSWGTTGHTGIAIPMSVVGIGAETFGGYKDNTEIAKNIADILGYELNK